MLTLLLTAALQTQPNLPAPKTYILECNNKGNTERVELVNYNTFAREGERLIFAKVEIFFGDETQTQYIKTMDRGETCIITRRNLPWPQPFPRQK